MRSDPATAAADENAKADVAKQKPVVDTQKDELPETDLEKVVGGIGSAVLGGGAGRA